MPVFILLFAAQVWQSAPCIFPQSAIDLLRCSKIFYWRHYTRMLVVIILHVYHFKQQYCAVKSVLDFSFVLSEQTTV